MAKLKYDVGEQVLASKPNMLSGTNNAVIAYNTDGTVNTYTDSVTSFTITFTYTSGKITSYTDGTNTFTLTYDSQDRVTNLTVT